MGDFNLGDLDDDSYKPPDKEMLTPPASAIPPFPQNLVTRADWGAKYPIKTAPLAHPIKYVRLTYNTDTERCKTLTDCIKICKKMQDRDIDGAGFTDIQYNFMIGGDARVYEGRGWNVVPNESTRYSNYNGKYLDIAFIGDHRENTEAPTFAILTAAWNLMEEGVKKKFIRPDFLYIHDKD